MRNQKFVSLFLSGLCLTLWSGAVSGQQRPPTPPPPPAPGAPVITTNPNRPQANPLLTNPAAPRPVSVFGYTLIPFETLEPSVQLTPDQSVKVRPIYLKLEADTAALAAAAQTPQEKAALNGKFRAMQKEADKQIDPILEPAQRKKAEGLMFEMVEMISVGVSPQMLRELKLTPDQRAQILKIVDVVQTKAKAVPKDEYRAKYPAIMQAERIKIPPMLTPAQKIVFDRYDLQGRIIVAPKPAAPIAPPVAKTEPTPAPPVAPAPPAPEKKP